MEITTLNLIEGSLSLIYILITLILSIILVLKYFSLKKSELLFIAIALIGLAGPWFPEALGFLTIIFTNGALSDLFYLNVVIIIFMIATAYLPIAMMSWLVAVTKLLNLEKRKPLLILFLVIFIVFEIIFFVFASIDLSLIGTFVDPFNSMESFFIAIFYIGNMIILLFTGFVFSYISMRSEIPKIKLKGRILLIGFIMFLIGGSLPYILYDIPSLIIARIVVLISSILLYLGLLLPNRVLRLFKIEY